MNDKPVPSNFEDKVASVSRMPHPDPMFVEALWAKLEIQAGLNGSNLPGRSNPWQSFRGILRTTWRWGLSLAAMAALIGIMIFSMNLLPKNILGPAPLTGTPTSTPRMATSTPEGTLPVTPSPAAADLSQIPNRLVSGACALPVSQAFHGQYLGRANLENLETLAGGGSADSGNFTFEIWLACGDAFGRRVRAPGHPSEVEGLGILAGWNYHGANLEGETRDYQGFEPYIQEQSSTTGMLSSGALDAKVSGIQFPVGIIPDFTHSDVTLRYVIKVQTPDGKIAGAAMTFVLKRASQGYRPTDFHVDALSVEELQTTTSPVSVRPSFPTIDPETLYPELKAIRALMDRYQDPLRSSPGWVYMKTKNENAGGNAIYSGLTEWSSEEWMQIDASGFAIIDLHVDRGADGQVLQQSYSKDGETHNLTYGTGGPYTPYRLDLGSELYNSLFRQLQEGKPIDRTEKTVNGKLTWSFAFTDTYTEPVKIDNILTSALQLRIVIDPQTGAELYSEMIRTAADGQEQLVWRQTYETVERVPQPPDEILSLLGQTPGPYQPPAPQGTPAPAGFDPSQSGLTLRSIPGDSFNQPTFWYGDIYAGDFLLGRVNFGGSPGGFCDRSADGSRLAFNFLVTLDSANSHETLRWLDLHDVTQVFDPAPDLQLVSKVTWSPQGSRLAFTACKAGRSQCGLYLLDADSNQVGLLSTAGVGYVPPVWKPDGSQIAFISTDSNNVSWLNVVDAVTGEIVYQGPFNADTWQQGAEAPTNAWGVEIPQGYTGSKCFK